MLAFFALLLKKKVSRIEILIDIRYVILCFTCTQKMRMKTIHLQGGLFHQRKSDEIFFFFFNEILLSSTFGMAGEEHLSYIGAFGELAVQFCRKIICLEF